MKSGSGGFSHEVKHQRKLALVLNFVLPLIVTVVIMLVVAMVVNVSFYRFEMDSALSTARSLASDRVRTADEVIRDYLDKITLADLARPAQTGDHYVI